jgi:hypothetical protein
MVTCASLPAPDLSVAETVAVHPAKNASAMEQKILEDPVVIVSSALNCKLTVL